MSLVSEFKTFAMRGNVIDLAVGVVIGGAFGKIVSTLVDQVIMPPIGVLTGGVNFSAIKVVLKGASDGKPEVVMGIGLFINAVVQFALVALAVFMLVRVVNSMTRKKEVAAAAKEPKPSDEVVLLTEIRDLLRKAG